MRDLIVDGVPMRDPQNKWGIDYTRSGMIADLSRALLSDPPYGFHGDPANNSQEAFFGTGREVWVLNVLGDTTDEHKQALRGLLGLFQQQTLPVLGAPQRSPLNGGSARVGQTFNVAADLVTRADFRLMASPAIERISESTARVTFTVENRRAFWMSNLYYTSSAVTFSSGTITTALDSTLSDSNAPVTDGLIRIKGPIAANGSVTIQDRGNAFRSVTFSAGATAIAATEYIVIDMATLAARKQTSAVWTMTTGTDVGALITTSSDGAFYLSPAKGANWPAGPYSYTVTAIAVGQTTATAIDFQLRRSYLT